MRDLVTLPGTWEAFSSGNQIKVSSGLWVQSTHLGMKSAVITVQEKGHWLRSEKMPVVGSDMPASQISVQPVSNVWLPLVKP